MLNTARVILDVGADVARRNRGGEPDGAQTLRRRRPAEPGRRGTRTSWWWTATTSAASTSGSCPPRLPARSGSAATSTTRTRAAGCSAATARSTTSGTPAGRPARGAGQSFQEQGVRREGRLRRDAGGGRPAGSREIYRGPATRRRSSRWSATSTTRRTASRSRRCCATPTCGTSRPPGLRRRRPAGHVRVVHRTQQARLRAAVAGTVRPGDAAAASSARACGAAGGAGCGRSTTR